MPVQHVDAALSREFCDLRNRASITETGLARHGKAGKSECTIVAQPTELHGDLITAGSRVANYPHLGPELGLAEG